jgi:hypothetical protein
MCAQTETVASEYSPEKNFRGPRSHQILCNMSFDASLTQCHDLDVQAMKPRLYRLPHIENPSSLSLSMTIVPFLNRAQNIKHIQLLLSLNHLHKSSIQALDNSDSMWQTQHMIHQPYPPRCHQRYQIQLTAFPATTNGNLDTLAQGRLIRPQGRMGQLGRIWFWCSIESAKGGRVC